MTPELRAVRREPGGFFSADFFSANKGSGWRDGMQDGLP
jgi:hypothetical protein